MITGQQLDRTTVRLVKQAGKGRVTTCALKEQAPTIARQIIADSDSPLLSHWGTSLNFDENARATIVHPKILTAIGGLAGIKMRSGDALHAGLLHTYGYLFSRLQTPFGFKRDRWLRPTIENGLRIPAYTIRAEPREGTLLQNLTYFLSQILFRDSPRQRHELWSAAADVADSVRQYHYDRLNVCRITEFVSLPDGDVSARRVALLTDLVRFFPRRKSQQRMRSLLVYAVRDPARGAAKLITCFSVSAATAAALCDRENFGRRKPIRLRYNGVVDGFPSGPLLGTRRLASGAS